MLSKVSAAELMSQSIVPFYLFCESFPFCVVYYDDDCIIFMYTLQEDLKLLRIEVVHLFAYLFVLKFTITHAS